jgi:hypothetical protein
MDIRKTDTSRYCSKSRTTKDGRQAGGLQWTVKSYGFVFKALEFAKQYPEYASLINVAEFERDVNTVGLLRELYVPLSQLTKKVHDTMTLAGSEAHVSGPPCYGSSREGVKRKYPTPYRLQRNRENVFPGRAKAKRRNNRMFRSLDHIITFWKRIY